jgi:hypothetical protein
MSIRHRFFGAQSFFYVSVHYSYLFGIHAGILCDMVADGPLLQQEAEIMVDRICPSDFLVLPVKINNIKRTYAKEYRLYQASGSVCYS